MKNLRKVLLFFVLVLSIVLAACNGNKVTVTVNYGFDFEPKTVSAEELDGTVLKAEKEGYTLVGWYYDDYFTTEYITNTKIQGNINIYAKWEAVNYNINYHLDGGTNNEANPKTYTIENEVILAEPTKEGFTFLGWYKEEALTNKVTSIAKGTTKDIDLYAKWTEEVLVRFVVDNDVVKTVNVSKGEQIVIPTAPAKEGYTFDNWYLGNDVYEVAETTESITVVGRYNINSYDVKYYVDNNELSFEKVYYNNKVNGLDNNPSKTGYEFKGWYSDSNFATLFNVQEDRITSDTNLYAKFEPISYEITYDADGGLIAATNPRKYTIEDEKTLVDSNKPGYTFLGWYSDAKYQNKVTKIEKGTTGNITLYAKFGIVNYLITYELNGGSNSANNPASYNVETETIVFADATKAGYEFKGWYGDKDYLFELNKIEKNSLVSNIVLYAKFEPVKYTITYELDGGTNSANNPATYTIEDEIVLESASKNNYQFVGWTLETGAPISKIEKGTMGNLTIRANYEEYVIITFMVDDSVYHTINVTLEKELKFPGVPVKDGYTFDNWYFGDKVFDNLNVKKSVEVTAQFNKNKYKVTYYVDSNEFASQYVEYNDFAGVLPSEPTKDGYEFAGWYKDEEFNNAFNLKTDAIKAITNLYAKFDLIEYVVTYELDNGTNSANNPVTYTIETETITLANASKEGHKFIGWYSDAKYQNKVEKIEKGTFGDITLYVLFEIETYKVNYIVDEKIVSTEDVIYNNPVVGVNTPSKTGYEFVGWYLDEEYKTEFNLKTDVIKNTTNLYAKFDLIEYKITYELDGGTNSESNPTKYTVETETITLANASKEGHKFIGWYSDAKYQNKVEKIEKGTFGDITLYVLFEIETYKVNYIVDEKIVSTEDVIYNNPVVGVNTPSKTGYEFAGWYLDEEYKTEFNLKTDVIKNTTNLYAKFDAVEYKITYELDGGTNSESNPAKYTIEDEVVFAAAVKEGYELVGWYSDAKYQNKVEKIEKGTTGNLTLYALYDVAKCTVTIYGNGGSLTSNSENIVVEDVLYNTQFIELNTLLNSYGFAPAKEGYRLAAFAYSATGDPIPMDELNAIVIKADLELYAYWAKQCKVRLNYLNDYKETIYDSFNIKTFPASILENVNLDGYNIIGWLDEDGKDFDLNTPFDRDFVLTAKVTLIEYTITYELDGGTNNANNPSIYTVEDEVTFADAFKEGYDFAGWNDADGASITKIEKGTTGIKTLTATYNIKKFDVVFYVDGGKYHTIKNVEYNNPTNELPDDPEKSGYNFDGWYLDENHTKVFNPKTTLITENTNVYAKFVDPNASVLNVIECVGANETVYVKISVADGYEVNDYKVYYLLNNEYIKVDSQLVRKISGDSEYIRADIVGLAAGKYTIKVELGDATTTRNVMVSAQDRSGYAHFNNTNGVGAYNNDGTLKANAIVVYVNESNKNTVTAKIGSKTYTGLYNILKNANASYPLDIRVLGDIGAPTLVATNTTVSKLADKKYDVKVMNSSGTVLSSTTSQADLISGGYATLDNSYPEINGLTSKVIHGTTTYNSTTYKDYDSYFNMLDVSGKSYITVEGIGLDATITQWGFTWKNCNYIEVKNLTFNNYPEDACSFEASNTSATTLDGLTTGNLWVHNNTFNVGKNNWDVSYEQDKHEGDGATDFKGLKNVTVSYNRYYKNHKTGLVGGDGKHHQANFTFHHNWYQENQARLPYGRQANMHMYNNYYDSSTGTNMQIHDGAYAFIENCYFKNTAKTFEVKKNKTDQAPAIKSYNNIFDGCGNYQISLVTHTTDREAVVTSDCLFGTTFDTDSTTFYYDSVNKKSNVSIMQEASEVPTYVPLHAGAGSGYYTSLELGITAETTYEVTFKKYINNTESTISTEQVVEGSTATKPSNPTLEGYEFAGWYTDNTFATEYDFSTPITADTSIFAKFEESTPVSYEKLELSYYYTARNTLKNTSYNNGQYPAMHVKTIYKVGDQFDSTYLSAIIDNQYITTGFTFSGFDSSTTGKKTITVTYGNYQGTFDVYVLAADFEVASNDKGYYAIVSSNYVVGETFESGNTIFTKFKTINQALEALEMVTPTATKRAYLQIAAGYYNEKVVINVPYLTITGSGIAKATYENDESYDATDLARATVIEWNSLYGMTTEGNGVTDKTHQTSYQVTDSTQTVYITQKAINCEIEQLTISNWWNNEERFNSKYNELKDIYYHDYDKNKDVYLASNNKITEHRALALLVQADMVILNTVSLLGYQDTVEFFTGRHFLTNCYITGATDYIFGTNGTTYIANSVIHTIYNGRSDQGGYVNAFKGQNASASDSILYGCIYDGCTFEADSNVANGIIALGRPWTTSSSVMIMNSTISAKYSTTPTASSSVGRYCNWNDNTTAAAAHFMEYNNNGDGAISASITGCTVLTDATEAAKYNNSSIIFGTTNGNVKYDNAWDGSTKPIVDTKVYYYFDGTATTSGYTFTGTVEKTTGTFGDMTIDATSGKLAARDSDTQMNAGTIITFTVTKASTVTITFNHYQEAYTVNGVASTSGVYTIQLAAGETFTFVATATSYLKSIVIS